MSDLTPRDLEKKIILPIAPAQWIHLVEPDTKFNAQGEYKLQLLLEEADFNGVTEPLKEMLEAALPLYEAQVAEAAKKSGKKPKPVKASEYQPWETDQLEDGRFVLKLKRAAKITDKDTGLLKDIRPTLVDAAGGYLKPEQYKNERYGNGTVVRCVVTACPYMMAANNAVGITLRLEKVQILDKVEYGGGSDDELGAVEGYTYQGPAGAVAANDDSDEGVYTV